MKVVTLAGTERTTVKTTKHMLAVVDDLRARIESGQFIAFAAVALDVGDACYAYAGSDPAEHVSRLRMQGAISQLLHDYLSGELNEGDTIK